MWSACIFMGSVLLGYGSCLSYSHGVVALLLGFVMNVDYKYPYTFHRICRGVELNYAI